MIELGRAHEEHVRDLLREATVARDSLPYTDEFSTLREEFYLRTFKRLSDSEFWTVLVNVAKKGGVRGKKPKETAPPLKPEDQATLCDLLPMQIGQRDQLPYTEKFDALHVRFCELTGMSLDKHQLWLAVLHLAK